MSYNTIPGSICIGKAGLAAGTTTTYTRGAAVTASLRGKAVACAAASNTATPTSDFVTGKAFVPIERGKGCIFVFGVTATDTVGAIQGEIVDLVPSGANAADTSFADAPQFPAIPDNFCPIGYLWVRIGADLVATSWTLGSSNLATLTGCARGFVDVVMLPDRPQTS